MSTVRWLQMWLKNFYQRSKKWMRCEKQHCHEIDTPSITTISPIHFQHKLNKEKWSGGKGEHLKKWCECENLPFTFSVMKIWLKIESGESTKEWSIKPMIGEEYKRKSEHNQWTYLKTSSRKWQQTERMCQPKKRRLSKVLGRKCAKLNERQEETKTIQ